MYNPAGGNLKSPEKKSHERTKAEYLRKISRIKI